MSERILVVDGEDAVRGVLAQVLGDNGYDVTVARTGEEGIKAFRRQPFPVVLTDIDIGRMSGIDLLDEIKLLEPDCLVVIMTGNAGLDTATSALRSGAYDYLTKPFDEPNTISNVVRRAVDQSRLVGENRSLMDRLRKTAEHLEALNKQLRESSNRDGLTGLFNHRYFREALEIEISRAGRYGHPFSLIFIDVDHFRAYNDQHGHPAGDALLRDLAGILRRYSRQSTLIARYGGEEFVLIVPESDTHAVMACAENLRRATEEYPFEGREGQPSGRVTLSAGVASFPTDGTDGSVLIEHADRALYHAKDQGRNTVCCWAETKGLVGESA